MYLFDQSNGLIIIKKRGIHIKFFLSFLIAIYLITSPIKADISILENDETISCESSPINTFSYLIPDSWNNCIGTITFKDFDYIGDMYTGEFKQRKLHGQGNYYYKADNKFKGDRYEGEFKEGELNGEGTYHFNDGRVWKGLFSNGEWITGKEYEIG